MILAIGGHAHGQILPQPAYGYSLDTMAPVDLAEFIAVGAAEVQVAMPEVVRYQLHQLRMRWTGYRGFRAETVWVYIVAGMHPMEAEPWLQLIASWFRLLAAPILTGPRPTRREAELPMRLVVSGFYDRLEERRQRRKWTTLDRLHASVWWCGDETCDCTQPKIERLTPNHRAGYPWICREEVWSGKFLTATGDYSAEEREALQFAAFREACRWYGVPIPTQAVMRLAGPKASLP